MQSPANWRRPGYPREVGPGVYDIHSPRVPGAEEIVGHLRTATAAFPASGCGSTPTAV